MPVGCRRCRGLLSIIAITRNIYFIDARHIAADTKNGLNNLSRTEYEEPVRVAEPYPNPDQHITKNEVAQIKPNLSISPWMSP
jgi:hypothetical protein